VSGAGITLERDGDLAHLVLDRPPRNAMDSALFAELRRLARTELPGLEVAGLLVHGRGRHFSSGADVEEILARIAQQDDAAAAEALRGNLEAVDTLARCPFPVVAAIAGCCFGSAFELALGCHYRIAARNALLALPEVQHGLMPGCGGTIRLPALVGSGPATSLILTGRALGAEEARVVGAVDRVVERAELLGAAEAFVRDKARARSEWLAGAWPERARGEPVR
jgi:enoyl-CoA hydratase/carnithine racemase